MNKTISIDWDGTLADWPGGEYIPSVSGPMKPGAADFVLRLQDLGYTVVILSCRAATILGALAIQRVLAANDIEIEVISDEKVPSIAYIDDRAMSFRGDWTDPMQLLQIKNKINDLEGLAARAKEQNDAPAD